MSKKEISVERRQSASRLRMIRENAGMTQEQFSEVLEISLSAYKKIESGENQISLDGLKKLKTEMSVSADYVLFGEHEGVDDVWDSILNCSEQDKMALMLRLLMYFTEVKKGRFSLKNDYLYHNEEIMRFVGELQAFGEE